MIDILYNNLNLLTAESVINKYNYKFADTERYYIWDMTDQGVFLYRDINSHFFRNDGKVFKLHLQLPDRNLEYYWTLHNELYDIATKSQDLKLEIPLLSKKLEVDDKMFLYTEVQRPNYRLGASILEKLLNQSDATSLLLFHIEQSAILISVLKSLDNKFNCGFPLHQPKLIIDQSDWFWADFKDWVLPVDRVTDTYIDKFFKFISYAEQNFNISVNKQLLINKAEKLWSV